MLLTLSCKKDKENDVSNPGFETNETIKKLSPNRPNLNISILLDLSDRINPKKYPTYLWNFTREIWGIYIL